MRQALVIAALATAALWAVHAAAGWDAAYRLGYGVVVVMALAISCTFLWLWRERTTPLALGMAFSWAGTASVLGWWWVYSLLDRPAWMDDRPVIFVCVGLYLAGAILHFVVFARSLSRPRRAGR